MIYTKIYLNMLPLSHIYITYIEMLLNKCRRLHKYITDTIVYYTSILVMIIDEHLNLSLILN